MGHEQVKISERFVLHSEYDHSTITKSAGYFFARNKDLKLKLPEEDEKGEAKNSRDEGN